MCKGLEFGWEFKVRNVCASGRVIFHARLECAFVLAVRSMRVWAEKLRWHIGNWSLLAGLSE